MQKIIETIKAYDRNGTQLTFKKTIQSGSKTAFILIFNRDQTTKHLCKVWTTKLEKLSSKNVKIYKILAFKCCADDIFKANFDATVKNFCPEDKDDEVFAVYGNCSKRLYSAAKIKSEDAVAVAIFAEDGTLLFLHSEPFCDNIAKKLQAII